MISSCLTVLSFVSMGMSSGTMVVPPRMRFDSRNESAYIWYQDDRVPKDSPEVRTIKKIVCRDMCSQNENFERLEEMASFKDNWNGYGAKQLPKQLIDRVRFLLMELPIQPEIFPSARGSIQLEYDIDEQHIEMEIFSDGNVELMEVNERGIFTHDSFPYNMAKIREVVNKFYATRASRQERAAL